MPNKITQDQMDKLKECLKWDKENFPKMLEEYTGITAMAYTAFQYYTGGGDYIADSDDCSLENLVEEVGIEVVLDA